MTTASPIHVLGFAGSLRQHSWNRRLLHAAVDLAPENITLDIHDLTDIPLYNADLDTDEHRPEAVTRFKQAITNADALLIVTPEYNHSIPGVLKNTIDWASRPAMRSPLAGKPVAIMGAAPGAIGSARAQQHLKLVLLSTLACVMPHPGVVVGRVRDKFDDDGHLTDEKTREFVADLLTKLTAWTRQLRAE